MKEEKMISIFYKGKEIQAKLISEILGANIQQNIFFKSGKYSVVISRRVGYVNYLNDEPGVISSIWENKSTGDIYELNHETMTLGLIFKAGI